MNLVKLTALVNHYTSTALARLGSMGLRQGLTVARLELGLGLGSGNGS